MFSQLQGERIRRHPNFYFMNALVYVDIVWLRTVIFLVNISSIKGLVSKVQIMAKTWTINFEKFGLLQIKIPPAPVSVYYQVVWLQCI